MVGSTFAGATKNDTACNFYYPYYKTVAHIDVNNCWQPIDVDYASDTACYILKDKPTYTVPELQDQVTILGNIKGTVKDITVPGFTIDVDPTCIYAGLSGTPVVNSKSEVIGYISASVDNESLYCIWR